MFKRIFTAVAAATVLGLVARVAAAAPPPLSAYGKLPNASHVVISPDGTRLALIGGSDGDQQVRVLNLADMKVMASAPVASWKVRGLSWAGSDHLLIQVSTTTNLGGDFLARNNEWFQLIDFDLKQAVFKQQMVDVRGLSNMTLNVIAGSPMGVVENGRPVAYVEGIIIPERKAQLALFHLDLLSGAITQIGGTTAKVRGWVTDPKGKPIARSLYDDETGHYALELASGMGWRTVYSGEFPLDSPYIAGLGHDPQSVLLRMLKDGQWSTFDVGAAATGLGTPIEGFGEGAIVDEPATGKPVAIVTSGVEGLHYRFLDPADEKRWEGLERAFKGETVRLVSWSDDRSKVALLVSGSKNGAAYYLVDVAAHRAEFLVDEYANLPSEAYNEQRAIVYTAQDGTRIPAFLTLPRGRDPKSLPLVVLPHGGPASHDLPGFDWWSQAIASRGYAVLQPQFRGSDGYGPKFLASGYGEWGRKMQTDVSDGVVDLAKQGVIDPSRVCIVGASYGGYAALAGVTVQNDVYRCAVAVAGPANLKEMIAEDTRFATDTNRSTSTKRYWSRFMGAKTPSDPSLTPISPALLAEKASAPILLIHGKDDTVVPYEQSVEMSAALKKAGKPVELVTLNHEDHWLSRPDTRLQMLTETLRFLAAHNPPEKPAKQVASQRCQPTCSIARYGRDARSSASLPSNSAQRREG